MSTQDTGQRQTKQNTTQKTKKISNTDATKNPGVNTGAREGYAVLASYNTPPYYSYKRSSPVKVLEVI